MGILYIEGNADQFDLFRIPQEFRTVFGGEVSSKAITLKNPEDTKQQDYFCMKLDVEEIDSIDSFTKLKIERVLKNIQNNSNFFKDIKWLENTPDLDYIFSLNEPPTATKNQTLVKEELQNIRMESTPSPKTSVESSSNYPSYDELSDLSDDDEDDEDDLGARPK